MATTMQNPSCFLYSPGVAKIEESPIPTINQPHDVIIRIGFVGVCGSDVSSPKCSATSKIDTILGAFLDAWGNHC